MLAPEIIITESSYEEEETLLHFLCREGGVEDLIYLDNSIHDENRNYLTQYNARMQQCVHVVASRSSNAVEMMQLLALWNADLNGKELKSGDSPLHIAVRVRNYALVEWLCQQPNVNKEALNDNVMTPYHIAFVGRDDRMMNLLKQNGASSRVSAQSESNSMDESYEPPCKSSKQM